MALTQPRFPLANIDVFNSAQTRGGIQIDPVTKSTRTAPYANNPTIVYLVDDVCGNPAWYKFGAQVTLNRIEDCNPVMNGQISVSGFLPARDSAGLIVTPQNAIANATGLNMLVYHIQTVFGTGA